MNHESDDPGSDGALDDAIRDALRVDVDAQQLAGLEHFWRIRSQRERWRRRARIVLTAAAAAAVFLAASLLIGHRNEERKSAQVTDPQRSKVAASGSVKPSNSRQVKRIDPALLPGRAPTALEQFMFAARSGVSAQETPIAEKIDDMIRRAMSGATLDPSKILVSVGLKHAVVESQLLARLPSPPENHQRAILRLLAECGSARSTPVLLRVARTESLRSEALDTLEQVVGVEELAQTVGKSADKNVRSALMRRLLTNDSPIALIGFLSLVRNEVTRSEALSVAKTNPTIAIPRLISLLDDGGEPVRVAAAITLGHINGPETTQLLISRVTERPANSREAWLALMACRDEMARNFLDYATRRPQLLGHYNNARVHWAQMIQ